MEAAGRNAVNARGFELQAPRIARRMQGEYNLGFVDVGGWDTHVGEGGASGYLAIRLEELGRGLAAYAEAMGGAWRDAASWCSASSAHLPGERQPRHRSWPRQRVLGPGRDSEGTTRRRRAGARFSGNAVSRTATIPSSTIPAVGGRAHLRPRRPAALTNLSRRLVEGPGAREAPGPSPRRKERFVRAAARRGSKCARRCRRGLRGIR